MTRSPRVKLRLAPVAALALAVPMSQVGHGLAYLARYGPDALSRQGQAEHAYFPAVVESAGALLGAAIMASLALIAIGHLIVALREERPLRPIGAGWPLLRLALLLLAAQTVIFLVQENVECVSAGLPAPAPGDLVSGTLLGQLPVALASAFLLRWLHAEVSSAIRSLRGHRPRAAGLRAAATRELGAEATRAIRSMAPRIRRQRGPPLRP